MNVYREKFIRDNAEFVLRLGDKIYNNVFAAVLSKDRIVEGFAREPLEVQIKFHDILMEKLSGEDVQYRRLALILASPKQVAESALETLACLTND